MKRRQKEQKPVNVARRALTETHLRRARIIPERKIYSRKGRAQSRPFHLPLTVVCDRACGLA